MKTKDGKAWVWNNKYRSDDVVSWSGSVDAKGYATGKGELRWMKSNNTYKWYAYDGFMVAGKLHGETKNRDYDNTTSQGSWNHGQRTGLWRYFDANGNQTHTKNY